MTELSSFRVSRTKYNLLLVEDSDDDVVLFELALRRTRLNESFEIVRRCRTSGEAISYLIEPPSMVDSDPRPEIVVLDLKLPGASGFDVLSRMGDMEHRPVVGVFTTSILSQDKDHANDLGADVFQTKTFQSDDFARFLNWLGRLAETRREGES